MRCRHLHVSRPYKQMQVLLVKVDELAEVVYQELFQQTFKHDEWE